MKSVYAIIPARYESSRFPGKPLVLLKGKPMFWHVWNQTRQCPLIRSVTLATDDARIEATAAQYGVPCIMTGTDHQSGTDRVYEAAQRLGLSDEDIIVNVQGDEPALNPAALRELIGAFADPTVCVATLAHRLDKEKAVNPDKVKVVQAENGDALYFSRACIPFVRDADQSVVYLGHIGLYAFLGSALKAFVTLPPSSLELLEKLEQLRFLENNIPIRVAITACESHGVDTPEDIDRALTLLTGRDG